ncbi:MAG: SDR family oxidoreductase [Rhodospirillaceae bacterium]|nr:SDR family oxidoreductase [Rhodospirillaceae bacterium]MBT4487678.1 SDR family oxidoreductase [Rhodospirillaceae bacterium]MBT5898271.1 SDR family oxidoreductase [Rhodospirillaceae bacterium]MBT6429714.1 SDR family oxidoreductase [Rhodospirillaceae bacterium]MBT7759782.1 SDR family oxidoreductase [Rhodospirillaceae bacterium]
MDGKLAGKRVLVTQADDYMGPGAVEAFGEAGAEVIADRTDLTEPDAAARIVEAAGHLDVLVANLAAPARGGIGVADIDDEIWASMFDIMVHPLHRLVRAVAPQMIERGQGKVIAFGSATALRGSNRLAAYSAARGAQAAYVRAVGTELARNNIQVNLIAQHFVESEVYFPESTQNDPKFQARLKQEVPLGRLARAEEDTALAIFLASSDSDFFVGQVIPFAGGWVG